MTVRGLDVVTAAVTPISRRREAGGTAMTPVGGVTSDDDVDGHMTKTDTCYTLLCSDASTPDGNLISGWLIADVGIFLCVID